MPQFIQQAGKPKSLQRLSDSTFSNLQSAEKGGYNPVAAPTNLRKLGTTEFEGLNKDFTAQGLTPKEVESNFIQRMGSDIFLKTDAISSQDVLAQRPKPETTNVNDINGTENIKDGETFTPAEPGNASGEMLKGVAGQVETTKSNLTTKLEEERNKVQKEIDDLTKKRDDFFSKQEQVLGDVKDQFDPFREDLEKSERDRLKIEENFFANQNSIGELDTLLNKAVNDIETENSRPSLASVKTGRVNNLKIDYAARTGVIEAVMAARNNQISVGLGLIDRTVGAIQADRQDQINYYNSVFSFYEKAQGDADKELLTLDKTSKDFMNAQLSMLENDMVKAEETADYIKGMMIDPATANMIDSAGITLNDTVEQINKKLADYSYSQERINTRNTLEAEGYKYVANPADIAKYGKDELVSFTDSNGVENFYVKPKEETVDTKGSISEQLAAFKAGFNVVDGNIVPIGSGAKASGQMISTSYNDRNINVDKVASSSLGSINEQALEFGGLVIGAVESSSLRTAEQQKALFDAGKTPLDGTTGISKHQTGMAIDLFPDQEYIENMRPIMEANGWYQTAGDNDLGHFEYIGNGVAGGEITAEQRLQARNLSVELFGTRAGADAENIKLIEDLLGSGKTIDDLRDELKLAGQSTAFTGAVKDAAEAITINLTKDKQERFFDSVDRSAESGNITRVKELLKKGAIDSLGVEESRKARGDMRTVELLGEIESDLLNFENNGGDTNIFTGTSEEVAQKIGTTTNTDLARIANKIQIAIQKYRQAISGAAFTESESLEYKAIFPTIGKTAELNSAKIQGAKEVLGGNVEFIMRDRMGSDAYDDIFNVQIDELTDIPEDLQTYLDDLGLDSVADEIDEPIVAGGDGGGVIKDRSLEGILGGRKFELDEFGNVKTDDKFSLDKSGNIIK